jgi:flagellar basal body-associated protein FliL
LAQPGKTLGKQNTTRGPLVPIPFLVGIALVALAGTLVWFLFLRGAPEQDQEPVLTTEARQYVQNLGLSEVRMQAAESFAGHRVVEILGRISNNGDRSLQSVEINCVFYNFANEVILRQRVPIVRRRESPLQPGDSREFRLPFDNIPAGWNQSLPQLVIAHIDFAE